MKIVTLSNILVAVLSILAFASAALGAYVGAIAALSALAALLTIRILGGRVEMSRWRLSGEPIPIQRRGPVSLARVEVREAADGNGYFRSQIASTILWAAAARAGDTNRPTRSELISAESRLIEKFNDRELIDIISPQPGSDLLHALYLSKLMVVMETLEND